MQCRRSVGGVPRESAPAREYARELRSRPQDACDTHADMPRQKPFLRSMRLVRSGDFARTFREGVRVRGAVMLLVVRANDSPMSRLGLSVGRVIWKSAVKRNRVRRIFRESFRLGYAELPAGFDYVLVPARPKLEPELAQAQRELVELAQRAVRRWNEGGARGRPPKRAAADGAAPSDSTPSKAR